VPRQVELFLKGPFDVVKDMAEISDFYLIVVKVKKNFTYLCLYIISIL
jgi:hypothetical protein